MTTIRLLVLFLCLIALAPAVGVAQQPPQPQDEFVPVSELPPEDRLPAGPLLVGAYAFAWLALGGYVFSVARRLSSVQRDIERLETNLRRGNRT